MKYTELNLSENVHVYLDISIDKIKRGRVVVELFKNHVPKTVENFRALCTGEKGLGGLKVPLHYKNSVFHKAVPECIVQGGDITSNDGTGGESIYGPYFEDENLSISHSEEGLLSMANCGMPHTNNSQFCVTLGEAPHLDNSHVVFGRVVKGYNIIYDISYQRLDSNFRPIPVCKIYDCGELLPGDDWGYCEWDYGDVYPPYPTDWEPPTSSKLQVSDIIKVATDIKDAGNQMFKNGEIEYALQKYIKSLRYIEWYLINNYEDINCFVEIRSTVRLNAALACIKLGQFREAIQHCNQVVNIETNAKALFRRGQAKERLNEHKEALVDLSAAQRLAPNDAAISAEIQRIYHFLGQYQQAERQQCLRMFKT